MDDGVWFMDSIRIGSIMAITIQVTGEEMAATMDFYSSRPLQSELMEALEPFMKSASPSSSSTITTLSPPSSSPSPPQLLLLPTTISLSPSIQSPSRDWLWLLNIDEEAHEPLQRDPATALGEMGRGDPFAREPDPALAGGFRHRRGSSTGRRRRAPGNLREPGRVAVAAEAGRQEDAADEEVLIGQVGSP